MKLLRAKLVGYKGIYNGMGLYELDLDLTKSRNNIIIIKGDNGSGKSTLFNALHMFPDNNFNLIEDMECSKSLMYDCDGIIYKIKIIHGYGKGGRQPTKAYIFKETPDGFISLNPNGNISSYISVLEQEFYIDVNFLVLSQISSENRGFVDMKPSERKKFVGSMLAGVEFYNDLNSVVTKKFNNYKNYINSINSKIDKLESIESSNNKLSIIESSIEENNSTINDIIKDIAYIENKIDSHKDKDVSSLMKELSNQYNDLNMKRYSSRRELDNIKRINGLSITDEQMINVDKTLDNKISKNQDNIKDLKISIHESLLEQDSLYSLIQNKLSYIQSISDNNQDSKFLQELEIVENDIDEIYPMIDELQIKDISNITSDEYISAIESLEYLSNLFFDMKSSIDDNILNKALDLYKSNKTLSNYDDKLYKLKSHKDNLLKSIRLLEDDINKAKILELRPKNCKIDSCNFIKDSINLDKKKLEIQLNKSMITLSELDKEIYDITNKINENNDISIALNNISTFMNIAKSNIHSINKVMFNDKHISILDIMDYVNHPNSVFNLMDNLKSKLDKANIIDIYNNLCRTRDKLQHHKETYLKMKSVIQDIEKETNELQNKVEKLSSSIEVLRNDILKLENELSTNLKLQKDIKRFVDEYNMYIIYENEFKLIEEKINTLETTNKDILELGNKLIDKQNLLNSLNIQKNKLNEDKLNVLHNIRLYKEYQEELESLQNIQKPLEVIKKATSMSTGIQTLYMSVYMDKILDVANNLLSHLFGGQFSLGKFVINSKEFKIPCLGNGITNEDISSMSTSQKCMISLVLSFSILCQSSIKYNILKLDEIDGGLDNSNRVIFVETLYRLISLLKAEQVFIISHNNEMNLQNCDLIILKSSDIYEGNIIYNYNE